MIKFLDGPAADVILALRRAPVMLRVVCARDGKWDALDQLTDEAKPSEAIHVYKLEGEVGRIHLCIRGKGSRQSGWYMTGNYRHLPEKIADEDVRSTEAWQKWCWANKDRILKETPA